MNKELETFFLIFFDKMKELETIYKTTTKYLLINSIISENKTLFLNILTAIHKKINTNDANHFHNNIINNFNQYMNQSTMPDNFKHSFFCISGFQTESKEIISNYLDIISDNFTKNDDSERTTLYLKKLQIDVMSIWKNSDNSDYFDDHNELNKIIQKNNQMYNNQADLFTSNSMINNLDEETKIKLITYYEKLLKKYSKNDKVKKKISVKKEDIKEVKVKITDDTKKEKKTKEKIPVSVKNTLWSLNFPNVLQGKCYCCKTEVISKNNFDCGHITSEKDGGKIELDNLKPICRSCNSSMGTMNMNDYMKKYGFDKIKIESV